MDTEGRLVLSFWATTPDGDRTTNCELAPDACPRVERVLELLEPIRATLPCDDIEQLRGRSGKRSYVADLPDEMCCVEGIDYFESLESPGADVTVANPDASCSTSPNWGLD